MEIDLVFEDDEPKSGILTRLSLALGLQYNVILLCGAGAFCLALASPAPLVWAGIAEAVWLLIALGFPGVSRWIRKHNDWASEPSGAYAQDLDAGLRDRAMALGGVIARIETAGRSNRNVSRGELHAAISRLQAIREAFVCFAVTRQRLSSYLEGMNAVQIGDDIVKLEDALRTERDPVAKAKIEEALAHAGWNLNRGDHALAARRSVDAQMSHIENTMTHIESVAAAVPSGDHIQAEIDALVARVAPADVVSAQAEMVMAAAR